MPRVTKSFKPKEETIEESAPVKPESADSLVGDPPTEPITSGYQAKPVNTYNRPYRSSSYGGSYQGKPVTSGYQAKPREYPERDVPTEEVNGILDVMPEGHGFLRPKYIMSDRDVYISASQIRRFGLRSGDFVEGAARPPKETERYFGLLQVDKINGISSDKFISSDGRPVKRTKFEDLTAIYPNKHLKLE